MSYPIGFNHAKPRRQSLAKFRLNHYLKCEPSIANVSDYGFLWQCRIEASTFTGLLIKYLANFSGIRPTLISKACLKTVTVKWSVTTNRINVPSHIQPKAAVWDAARFEFSPQTVVGALLSLGLLRYRGPRAGRRKQRKSSVLSSIRAVRHCPVELL